jgi:hypothetical protein
LQANIVMRLATILAIVPLIPLAAYAQSNRLLVYKYPMVPATEYIAVQTQNATSGRDRRNGRAVRQCKQYERHAQLQGL